MMNDTYTAQSQAQKGFKTFILTLSVSLIIFSVIYYFISDTQPVYNGADVAEEITGELQADANTTENTTTGVMGKAVAANVSNSANEDIEEATVFGKLSSAPVVATSRAVLAGTDAADPGVIMVPAGTGTTSPMGVPQSTPSAVPSTGVTQLTWGFFISLLAFLMGFVVISRNPRGVAISHFEKKMLNK